MKIHQLSAAVFIAVALLTACSDDNKEKSSQENTASVQNKALSITVTDAANQAESRYKGLAVLSNRLFDTLSHSLFIQHAQMAVDNYQRGDNDATADTTLTLVLNPSVFTNDRPAVFQVRDNITYNQALLDRGVIANIQSQPIVSHDELAQIYRLQEESIAKIEEILTRLQFQTELLPDDNVTTKAEISPFQLKNQDGSVDFQGAVLNTAYNEKDILKNIGAGNAYFKINPVSLTSVQNDTELTIPQMQGEYHLTTQGELSFNMSPLKIQARKKQQEHTIEADGIQLTGQHYLFDSILRGYTGTVNATVNNINLIANGVKTHFGDIEYHDSTIKNIQGNYDIQTRYHIKSDGEALQQKFAFPVQFNSISVDNDVRNLSPELIQSFMQFMGLVRPNALQQQPNAVVQQALNTILNNLILNRTAESLVLNINTDAGSAQLNFNISIREDSKINGIDDDWQQSFAHARRGNFFPLKKLLESYLDFSLVLSVDKSLIDAFGQTAMLEKRLGFFITLKDGKYQLQLENDNGTGLKLNGHPLPF